MCAVAVDTEGAGSLSAMLLRLRRSVLEDGQGLGRRLHRHLFASTTAMVCGAALAAVYLWESFTSHTLEPWFLFFGAFSCTSATSVFRTRGLIAQDAVDEAIALSRAVEASLEHDDKKRLEAVARWSARLLGAYRCFGSFALFSLAYNMVREGELLAAPLKTLFKIYAGAGAILAFYQLLPLHLILYAVITALFVAAAAPVQVRGGHGSTVWCGVLCSRLQLLCRRADLICGPLYPAVLLCSMLMPMVTLADGVQGEGATSSGYMSMTLLFVILVPLCMGGQNIQDSSLAVSDSCYGGPWLAETLPERRCRLMVMQMSSVASGVHVHRLATLNRPTCVQALRKWFSFFQVLLNLRDQHGQASFPMTPM